MMIAKVFTTFFLLLPIFLFSQTHQIKGYLKDTDGKPVASVTVILKNSESKLLAFKNSDQKGYFEFSLSDTIGLNRIFIEVNFLGYKKIKISAGGEPIKNILMETQEINLKDIEIKTTLKIRSGGDTIKYDVNSFKKSEDRAIGDVISRMPGMEVNEKGEVKYNGKSISSLYINGDNLLDDKYSIGTKAIPADIVKSIEVLQNHQSTRVLQNKVLSDAIAVNLVIVDSAKTKVLNQVKIGVGLPKQYDGEVTNIAFNDKFKALNVLKANNTGIDLATDFSSFNFSENLSQLGISYPKAILSLGNVDIPPLPKQRYYFNHSKSLNLNNLINLKDSLQLKANINLLHDKNNINYQSQIEIYLPDSTVRYTEFQETANRDLISEFTFTLEANKAKSFIRDDLRFTYRLNDGNSNLVSNNQPLSQKLRNQIQEFSNNLNIIPSLKSGNILSIDWHLSHFNRPEQLDVNSGVNSKVLNNNEAFRNLSQGVEIPTWTNRLALSYNFAKYEIKHSYELGILNEFQKLNSDLLLTQLNGAVTNVKANPNNELLWRRQQFFIASKFEYKSDRWETSLYAPITWRKIFYEEKSYNLKENISRIFLNPNFKARYYLSAESFLTLNYYYQNQIGNIVTIYPGLILTNYRNLVSNQAQLQQKNIHFASLQFNTQKATKMLFLNAGVNYRKILANTITSNEVSDEITKTVILPIRNNVESLGATLGISKFIRLLSSTANLEFSFNKNRSEQIFSGQRIQFEYLDFSTKFNVEAELFRKIRVKYIANLNRITSSSPLSDSKTLVQNTDIQIVNLDNAIRFSWSPYRNLNLLFNLRHSYTMQTFAKNIGFVFADMNFTYQIPKIKTDFELNLINLTNLKSFQTYTTLNNSLLESNFRLRERMVLIKAVFSL
ncbi:carboxypeptidase-like regulatory domain-containing protein [Pedobacter jamesrossensis]|uniref:Carboxypeptidase-like regulatory domain-containing protein n=1 Tax=Pedobacter jamesrossensis TaxID=1908238 RepID=A0ABV8NH98_9SPHI